MENTADGFNSDSELVSCGTSSNGSTGTWEDQFAVKEVEVCLYVTETPDPEGEEQKADHISGQSGL